VEEGKKIAPTKPRKTLKDFTRLIMAFFGCLIILSVFQNLRLYFNGVLDDFINKSLLLLIIHHIGFAALISLILVFLFNILERKRPQLGFKFSIGVLMVLLIMEALLVEYYIQNYEILGLGFYALTGSSAHLQYAINTVLVTLFVGGILLYYLYQFTGTFYKVIGKMYPFTIVLFGLFLVTLTSNKRPINENKIQHLVTTLALDVVNFNKYDGKEEYPLLKPFNKDDQLRSYFNLKEEKPNIVILIVDGLGSDFVGANEKFGGFTPFIDSLAMASLRWNNFVSNTGEGQNSIASILGSLPFGSVGFTNLPATINRQTLYSILNDNGYNTSFNYGGNSAINHLDRFMYEERVDHILDSKGFGVNYAKQEEDGAGISLGYPDKSLFLRWNELHVKKQPSLDVFFTLSTRKPFKIPNKKIYLNKVEEVLKNKTFVPRSRKLIKKNKALFASFLYADASLRCYFNLIKNESSFKNTLFIITGSHNIAEIPQESELDRYKVPFFIYSPMLKRSEDIPALASHLDILPSLVGMLESSHKLKIPDQNGWLGKSLIGEAIFDEDKQIPLFRNQNNIKNYISGKHFLSGRSVHKITTDLSLEANDVNVSEDPLRDQFYYFKAVNDYVTSNNKLIPEDLNVYDFVKPTFSKEDMVWINSVFNGNDFDGAYNTARDLAINSDRERALLLCNYILSKIPGHADTEILMGRVYAWEEEYPKAITALKSATVKYPTYTDGYAALLDVYFWSDNNKEVLQLYQTLEANQIQSETITKKLARAYNRIKQQAAEDSTFTYKKHQKLEAITAMIAN